MVCYTRSGLLPPRFTLRSRHTALWLVPALLVVAGFIAWSIPWVGIYVLATALIGSAVLSIHASSRLPDGIAKAIVTRWQFVFAGASVAVTMLAGVQLGFELGARNAAEVTYASLQWLIGGGSGLLWLLQWSRALLLVLAVGVFLLLPRQRLRWTALLTRGRNGLLLLATALIVLGAFGLAGLASEGRLTQLVGVLEDTGKEVEIHASDLHVLIVARTLDEWTEAVLDSEPGKMALVEQREFDEAMADSGVDDLKVYIATNSSGPSWPPGSPPSPPFPPLDPGGQLSRPSRIDASPWLSADDLGPLGWAVRGRATQAEVSFVGSTLPARRRLRTPVPPAATLTHLRGAIRQERALATAREEAIRQESARATARVEAIRQESATAREEAIAEDARRAQARGLLRAVFQALVDPRMTESLTEFLDVAHPGPTASLVRWLVGPLLVKPMSTAALQPILDRVVREAWSREAHGAPVERQHLPEVLQQQIEEGDRPIGRWARWVSPTRARIEVLQARSVRHTFLRLDLLLEQLGEREPSLRAPIRGVRQDLRTLEASRSDRALWSLLFERHRDWQLVEPSDLPDLERELLGTTRLREARRRSKPPGGGPSASLSTITHETTVTLTPMPARPAPHGIRDPDPSSAIGTPIPPGPGWCTPGASISMPAAPVCRTMCGPLGCQMSCTPGSAGTIQTPGICPPQ